MKFLKKKEITIEQEHLHPSKGSIRRKFVRIFIILGILPIIALGIAGIVFLTISRQQSIEETETLLLRQKTEETARFIDETLDTFEIQVSYTSQVPPWPGFQSVDAIKLSNGYTCNSPYDNLCDEQLFFLEGLLAANRNLVEVAFINTILPTAQTNVPPAGKETKRLSRFYDIPTDCGLESSPQTVEECEYYAYYPNSDLFRAVSSGKNYIGKPYKTLDGYYITIAAPVYSNTIKNDKGEIIEGGYIVSGLRGELSLKPLNNIFASAILGEAGYAYLVDEFGSPIASSVGKDFPQGLLITNPLTEKLNNNVSVTGISVYKNLFGETVVASAKPVGRLNLGVVVEWPYSDAYSIVYSIANQVVFFMILILVAIIVLSRTLARQITKPISILQFAASRIGKGSFDPISEIKTGDELELLAHSLNDMSHELRDLDELKRKAGEAKLLELSLAKEKELVDIKDSFLDTASHQLRTPISAIKWQLELLLGEDIPPTDKELVAGAYEHAEFLSEISTDLINAASYGIGYKAKDMVEVSISKLLTEICEHFAGAIEKNKIKFVNTPLPEDIKIKASYPALRVLFENILGNAIRYTKPEGQITITVIKQENSVEIRVADTGIGIPSEEHKMVFTQFFRAVNAIDTRNVGTGLGLYISRNIVWGHEGNIWFTSELGKGSTFFVSLPTSSQR